MLEPAFGRRRATRRVRNPSVSDEFDLSALWISAAAPPAEPRP
ncbi:MAG: hypothetical protein CHACPFDD_01208 [Phycisphaerae bacterium]|nr:hypothetical protein [Phycisphaerae bacterium]